MRTLLQFLGLPLNLHLGPMMNDQLPADLRLELLQSERPSAWEQQSIICPASACRKSTTTRQVIFINMKKIIKIYLFLGSFAAFKSGFLLYFLAHLIFFPFIRSLTPTTPPFRWTWPATSMTGSGLCPRCASMGPPRSQRSTGPLSVPSTWRTSIQQTSQPCSMSRYYFYSINSLFFVARSHYLLSKSWFSHGFFCSFLGSSCPGFDLFLLVNLLEVMVNFFLPSINYFFLVGTIS